MAKTSPLGSLAGVNLDAVLADIQRKQGGRLASIEQQEQSYTSRLSAYGKVAGALTDWKSAAAALAKAFGAAGDDARPDADKIKSAVKSFVDAYNAAQKVMAGVGGYDKSTGSSGALFGDKALADARTQLRDVFSQTAGGALADYGLSFDSDGTLQLDQDKLDAAIQSNPGGVRQFFIGDDGDAGLVGRATALVSALTGKGSPLAGASDDALAMLALLDQSHENESDRVQQLVASYRAQFQQLSLVSYNFNVASMFMSDQLAVLRG